MKPNITLLLAGIYLKDLNMVIKQLKDFMRKRIGGAISIKEHTTHSISDNYHNQISNFIVLKAIVTKLSKN